MSAAVADDARTEQARQADRLLDLWSGLALRHVSLGGACGCGSAGGVSLRLEDFELDIVDYLLDAAARSEQAAVAAWGMAALRDVADSGQVRRMRDLLSELQQVRTAVEVSDWLLPRLERTLNSYAEQHGRG